MVPTSSRGVILIASDLKNRTGTSEPEVVGVTRSRDADGIPG